MLLRKLPPCDESPPRQLDSEDQTLCSEHLAIGEKTVYEGAVTSLRSLSPTNTERDYEY